MKRERATRYLAPASAKGPTHDAHRTRNLQTTNRNVRSPKTMTRPVRPSETVAGRDRTTDSSTSHAIASRKIREVFAVTMPSASLRCETETMRAARTSFPPRSLPSSAGPNED
jgi:hypothetical protein